jgi:hypothetical protein
LEDGHTLFDYDVGLNDIVQLMVRVNVSEVKDMSKTPVKEEQEVTGDNGAASDDDHNVRIP